MTGPCPTPERLAAALRSRQPGGDADLAAHLADCPACQAKLESLAGGSGWLGAKARAHTASKSSEALQRAMSALESHSGDVQAEASTPPKLDFLQPADQPGVLGRFGPYEVLEHVASGGMGIVIKARDPALNRIVALKILPPALAANLLARARFVREARAAAAVVHEHVVPIYAVDECGGLPYLVMQFVHGRSLSERIRMSGPLRLEEILRIGGQTAAGLAAAHAQGLIHRDVKPGNILLQNSVERVKLTDFGLARAVEDAGLTRTGELAGTPEYMAPEQAGNEAVDHRSDLFSFGSVLYAMCTGRSPFQASSVIAAVRKVCDEQPPPVHEINREIPRWLSDIIARLMAKAPAERFQSAEEIRELLERYLARVQRGELGALPDHWVRQKPTHQRRRLSYAVGAVATLAAVGLLMFALKGGRAPSPTAGSQAASQPAFSVRDQAGKAVGAYADLAEAARAAPPAGVIEFRWNGSREMPPVTLPPKPLTLRAAEGFRPRWIHTTASQTALKATAALTVEDIEFALEPGNAAADGNQPDGAFSGQRTAGASARLRGPRALDVIPSGIGLISISNAPLRLSRCVLQLQVPAQRYPPGIQRLASLAAVALENVTTCEIENSVLFAGPGKAILWRQTTQSNAAAVAVGADETRLSLTNCLMTALGFWMELSEDSRARLEMVRCTFAGPILIRLSESNASKALTVTAQASLLSGILLQDDRSAVGDTFTSSVRWQGSQNLFGHIVGTGQSPGFLVLAAPGTRLSTLAQWNRWWPMPETSSREVNVTFAFSASATSAGGSADFARTAYKVTKLEVIDGGPPLPPDQWSRFGADIANVGPRSAKP